MHIGIDLTLCKAYMYRLATVLF